MARRRLQKKTTKRLPRHWRPQGQPPRRDRAEPRFTISRRRLWLFRIIAATASCLIFLALVEGFLRIAGCGYPAAPILRYRTEGFDGYVDNARFSWRFFPPNIAREFEPFTLQRTKPKDTFRIFICGGSAAEGIPDASYSFARFLEVMLHHCYPDRSFEVINTGMTAVNSHVVLPIVRDCARLDPDLFIVYLGNNEVVGPYGAGTVFAGMADQLWLIRAGIALRTTRTGQLLDAATSALHSDKNAIRTWGGMQMFLDKQVRPADKAMQTVYAHFQKNLEDIRTAALHAGAPIVFCTVGTNLKDCPPFASLHRPDLTEAQLKEWRQIYNEGVAMENAGRFADAAERYRAAARIDDTFADLHFRLAVCCDRLGQFADAGASYTNAREHDTLRFRADDKINGIIRQTASADDPSVTLLDFAKILEENSPNALTGREYFHEHVHLNFAGNYLLAKSLFDRIEPELRRKLGSAEKAAPPTESDCARYLAWTDWDRCRLTQKVLTEYIQKPPFTNQLYHDERVASLQGECRDLQPALRPEALRDAVRQYRWAIQQDPADWNLRYKLGRLLTEDLTDYPAAAVEFAEVQKCVPHFHLGYTALGQVFAAQGKYTAAIDQYRQAMGRYSASGDACYYLAVAYARMRQYADAEHWYRRAIALRPTSATAFNNLAEMLFRQKKYDEAFEVCRRGLAVAPDDPMLHGNLAILLNELKRKQEAMQEIETALKLDPNSANIRRVHQRIYSPD